MGKLNPVSSDFKKFYVTIACHEVHQDGKTMIQILG